MSRGDDLFNEWAAESLMDGDEQAAWQAMRSLDLGLEPGCVPDAVMRQRWAADRAAVEATYEPRDFGWWNSEDYL